MLKHTISIPCCLEVAVVVFSFRITKPRKELKVDSKNVNKTEKAFLGNLLAIYT